MPAEASAVSAARATAGKSEVQSSPLRCAGPRRAGELSTQPTGFLTPVGAPAPDQRYQAPAVAAVLTRSSRSSRGFFVIVSAHPVRTDGMAGHIGFELGDAKRITFRVIA